MRSIFKYKTTTAATIPFAVGVLGEGSTLSVLLHLEICLVGHTILGVGWSPQPWGFFISSLSLAPQTPFCSGGLGEGSALSCSIWRIVWLATLF